MNLILGMDIWIFIAWIGTILATIFCIFYGLYHEYIKKSNENISSKVEEEISQKKGDD